MNRKLLYIGYVWPEPQSSAAGWHTTDLLRAFSQIGYEIHLASSAAPTEFSTSFDSWKSLGVVTHFIKLNCTSFDEFIRGLQPDVVVFDRFITEEQFGARVYDNLPGALRIVDMQDFHTLRKQREEDVKVISKEESGSLDKSEFNFSEPVQFSVRTQDPYFWREAASLLRSDGIISISHSEKRELLDLGFPEEKVTCFSYFKKATPLENPTFQERKDFIFLGNQRHPPNADALGVLKNGLWDSTRSAFLSLEQQPPELHVWGAYENPRERISHSKTKGIIFKGRYIGEVTELLKKYRVLLAPLRYGAGVKGKILDAWIAGTPVLTTDFGLEGLITQVQAVSDFYSWGKLAHKLYGDENCWKNEVNKGQETLRVNLSSEEQKKNLEQALEKWKLTKAARSGQLYQILPDLLFSQSLASTRYFSKWIELKEAKKLDQSSR